jgi:hypothetical protein
MLSEVLLIFLVPMAVKEATEDRLMATLQQPSDLAERQAEAEREAMEVLL